MSKFSPGTVAWATDPTKAHNERPVVVLAHENRPFSSVECTVMCLGTGANDYDQYTPELTDAHLSEVSFTHRTYLMPWALYTIPPSAIQSGKASGTLTEEGERLVKKGLISLFNVA
jgi:hypothetical protein